MSELTEAEKAVLGPMLYEQSGYNKVLQLTHEGFQSFVRFRKPYKFVVVGVQVVHHWNGLGSCVATNFPEREYHRLCLTEQDAVIALAEMEAITLDWGDEKLCRIVAPNGKDNSHLIGLKRYRNLAIYSLTPKGEEVVRGMGL